MGFTVVGIGELLWDMLPGGRQPGGAPGNFACHAAAFGCDALLVSRVGKDAPGQELVDRMDSLGVRCDYITFDPDHETGRSTVEVDPRGVPEFVVHERAAWDFIEYAAPLAKLARQVDAAYYGTLPQRTPVSGKMVESFLRDTRQDAIRLFDVNLRRPHFDCAVIESSLEAANVLKLNDDELSVLTEFFSLDGDVVSKLRQLAGRFDLRAIALTRGPNGSVLIANDEVSVHHGYPANVVDTVGAGDAFSAALVIGLLNGDRIESIARRANRVAAYVCSQPGATPVIPPEILTG